MCVLRCSAMSDSFETTWTEACQTPLPMKFSRKEQWGWVPFPPPRDFPDPGIEPLSLPSPYWQADSLPLAPPIIYVFNKGIDKLTFISICGDYKIIKAFKI